MHQEIDEFRGFLSVRLWLPIEEVVRSSFVRLGIGASSGVSNALLAGMLRKGLAPGGPLGPGLGAAMHCSASSVSPPFAGILDIETSMGLIL